MQQRTNFTPAMAAAVLLHVGVLLATILVWPSTTRPLVGSGVTTVTVVDAPAAELRPAAPAPTPAAAAAETPVAEAPPEPPSPTPSPEPPAPPPLAKAAPAKAAPTQPTPAPARTPKPQARPAAKAQASPGLDLDALTSSLSRAVKAGGARASSAARGPANRRETALAAREGKGADEAALTDAGRAVGERLMRMWNPNCDVEGAGAVSVRVRFNLTPDGELAGEPQILDRGSGAVWQAAADRARRAVAQAAPYNELPKQSYSQWKTFTARFNGEQACR